MPMGGVINPISILTANSTANQMGSNPMDVINGRKMGKTIIMMVMPSITHPRISSMTIIAMMTTMGLLMAVTRSAS